MANDKLSWHENQLFSAFKLIVCCSNEYIFLFEVAVFIIVFLALVITMAVKKCNQVKSSSVYRNAAKCKGKRNLKRTKFVYLINHSQE